MHLTVTKTYRDFPAAHRQPNHDGHCRLIHGHNWDFEITFQCARVDENGFVIDVGKLKEVKEFLTECFDHTLLINENDPIRRQEAFGVLHELSKIVIVPNCGMEGLAQYVLEELNRNIHMLARQGEAVERDLAVIKVTVWEDSKNSASYYR